jgi:prophage regulatory protein
MVDQEHELMRPDEVADFLGLGRSKTYALIAAREIPVVTIGRSVRVPRAALREWVRERTESPLAVAR